MMTGETDFLKYLQEEKEEKDEEEGERKRGGGRRSWVIVLSLEAMVV